MFKRAIVTTNLSENSNTIIGHLEKLKSYGTEEILLLRALNVRQASSIGLAYEADGIETSLSNEKNILEDQGFRVEVRTVTGRPENEINRIAVQEDYSIIVVGAKEETLLRQAFFGELAYDIIHNSEKPVLLVRLGDESSIEMESHRHILFATDFSENSEIAFESVKGLIKLGAARVSMVHVQDKSIVDTESKEQLENLNRVDRGRLEIMEKILKEKRDIEVDIVLKSGSPSVEILKLVEELKVDLVVMGTHGRGFVKELFLGSVSNHIARHSKSPVLLIPNKHKRAYK